MSRQLTRTQQTHPVEVRQVYERVLAGSSVRGRPVEVGAGGRAHLLEKGEGPPVVLLHGTGNSAGFLLPLLHELHGVRAIAPDLPGVGLSDPIELPADRYRETAVAWLDRLLDTLELDATTLVGHSGGGVWALWYALAHPDRVRRLVLIGPPALPRTSCPLPMRLVATPGVGALLPRLAPPSPKSVLRLASVMGEQATLARRPELIDLLVALGRDPVTDRAAKAEIRLLVSPFALLSRSGFRGRSRVRPGELRQVAMPTLIVWGERDPLGGVPVAQAITDLIPHARLEVLPTGHGPWLGEPARTAAAIVGFVH
ncbi:MAG: alpha/beta hydrolase [Actinomycetia bacterium]|jgi:pimeloyl-ACP methyl ester carboxylesterase|nr:alpha/beta hydrolase [Actinomycetes bacterium]